ncbi:hypothetical protein EJV44_20260 [Ancylobacter aquaticus]|nr:hypothetical protein EJV44_20260 [Ancylobacter aquaticus]
MATYVQHWVEIAISALTPIALTILTYFITNAINKNQHKLRTNENLVGEKRLIYSDIGRSLNIIYIYSADIGDFRLFSPDQIIDLKRDVDRKFNMYKPYWSSETINRYNSFMNSAFVMYIGVGEKPLIYGEFEEKKEAFVKDGRQWEPYWDYMFTNDKDPSLSENYEKLVASFLSDIVSLRSIENGQVQ